MRAAKLFIALARFGGLAFEAIARLALAPSPGIRLLAAAIVLLRRTRVDQRPGARFALLGAQGGQDDTGLGGGGAVGLAGATGAGRAEAVSALGAAGGGAAAGAAGADRAAAAASAGVKIRRFTFSTTTALLRPCEKLCLTVPCSTGRFRCNVAFGGAAVTVLSLLPVSLMPLPNHLASQPI